MSAAFPGSAKLFQAEKRGGKGLRTASRANLQREESLVPPDHSLDYYDKFLARIDPLAEARDGLRHGYRRDCFSDWLWKMQLNFNILLYGFGSKTKLMKSFCDDCLSGEDVVSISGTSTSSGQGIKIIKALLDTICCKILQLPVDTTNAFASIQVYSEFIQGVLSISDRCTLFRTVHDAHVMFHRLSELSLRSYCDGR
jgi:hypothetical protein